MNTPKILEVKHPSEVVNINFDFTAELGAETISTKVTTAATLAGTDASPGDVINGAATESAGVVIQSVRQGLASCDYLLSCTIATSGGRTIVLQGILPVRLFA
ncbi:MAG: hypothetical protein IT518_04700 [Burkholderiales bacterium]|nr:hypothetical protein [Burkholderiales bacterium]